MTIDKQNKFTMCFVQFMWVVFLGLWASSVAGGQSVTQLPRITPTTGLADSSLFLCSDSTKTLTRACKFSDVQKRLAFKTFDSLVTSTLRATGAITVGSCVGCGGGVTYPLAATDGSAAAPSIAFANSTGTGLYRFNADTLGFATAGLLRATLSASGSGASFRASGAGNLVLGPGTGNGRAVTVQGTSATGVLTSYLQVDRTAVSALNGAIFQGAGTAAAPMFSVQNGGGGGLGMYSPTIDTVAFSSLSAYTLGISGGAAAHLTGGAGNMTIQAGTGNSRRLAIQTTTSAGAATEAFHVNEVQQVVLDSTPTATPLPNLTVFGDTTMGFRWSPGAQSVEVRRGNTVIATFLGSQAKLQMGQGGGSGNAVIASSVNNGGGIYLPAAGTVGFTDATATYLTVSAPATGASTLQGGAGNMIIQGGTGASRTLTLQTTNNSSVATTFISGSGDTLKTTHIIASGLTAASGTPNSLCLVSATKQVTENAATSCVVSSIRFKKDTAALSTSEARRIISKLTPETFTYKDGGRKAIGLIAEQVDTVDHRLTFKNSSGELNSVDYQALGPILIKIVQDQQRQLDSIKTILKARKP